MNESDIIIPAYYLVDRNKARASADQIIQLLSITPLAAVVVENIADFGMALQFCEEGVFARDAEAAIEAAERIYKQTGRSVLILTSQASDDVQAVYSESRERVTIGSLNSGQV